MKRSKIHFLFFGALLGLLLQATASPPLAELPWDSSHGRVTIKATINSSKPLTFLLDTGYGIDMVHPDLVDALKLRSVGHLTIVGIAGEERAGKYAGAVFDFNGAAYAPHRVASLPSEAGRRWRRRDGILGADFFRRFVVEIDSDTKKLRLFEPTNFVYSGHGEIVPVHFIADTPIIRASVVTPAKETFSSWFEVDTGCDDDLCLGHPFVESNKLDENADNHSGGFKNGVGGGAPVHHGELAELQIGALKLEKPSANFFTEGSPAAKGLAGHIGMSALRHWTITFDYTRNRMILEKR